MKVESIEIKNFKRFDHLKVSLCNEELGEVSDRFLILGDNGSGKTTLLQAIALPLALVSYRIPDIHGFEWPGFVSERFYSRGRPLIEMWVTFEDEEIKATHELAMSWCRSLPSSEQKSFTPPGNETRLKLILEGEYFRVENGQGVSNTGFKYQFLGRYYVRRLLAEKPAFRDQYARLPGVFWFDQTRALKGMRSDQEYGKRDGLGSLRKYLVEWQLKKNKGWSVPYLDQVQKYYARLFPGHVFDGLMKTPDLQGSVEDKDLFMISDGVSSYELEEMSGGEQSLFPILYEMVRLQIAHSVVLIDEADLNLHPPLARKLVNDLYHLAPNSQFILTTHSESVSSIFGEGHIYRLKGGHLCL